jgi:hypothetical protein
MNEIAKRPDRKPELVAGGQVMAIIPRTIDEVWRLSEIIVGAGLAPDSYRGADNKDTAKKVVVGIMKGAEVGLPPITALSSIAVINGRPSIWGDGAKALIENSGKVEDFKETLTGEILADDWTAVCEIKRKGQETPIVRQFSWADAKRANLIGKGPWKQYPQRMLQMRARSWAIRDGFSDCLSGLAIVEEARDMPPMKDVTPDTSFLDDEAPAVEDKTDWYSKAVLDVLEKIGECDSLADLAEIDHATTGLRQELVGAGETETIARINDAVTEKREVLSIAEDPEDEAERELV